MFNLQQVKTNLGGRDLIIETGKLAKQASGSVVVRYGDTVVLVTATASSEAKEGIDFLPLTVDFVEKTFAAGKIPGGFFKREGRPSEQATLTSRFIDRPIRPLFPEGYTCETQVIATVLAVDRENQPDILAMIGASAALMISDVPFTKAIAGVRVVKTNGELVINPIGEQAENTELDLIVAATKEAVVMVEGGASEVSEADLVAAIEFAHEAIKPVIAVQEELAKICGKPKREVILPEANPNIAEKVSAQKDAMTQAMVISEKLARYEKFAEIKSELKKEIFGDDEISPNDQVQFAKAFEEQKSQIMRQMITKEGKRIDGRGLSDIRPIISEVKALPRVHGSGLFTRGETQALVVATLGGSDDEQTIDSMTESSSKKFMLHYNFPPFSVGEARFLRSPGRREIGHGALAERALIPVLPEHQKFPYTIRIVSEILESNGSSSMATVCGGSLAMMDAGVPIKAPVAGIAMGLICEDGQFAILSDILGDEDHLGDMDFKVTGTQKGVTALQMDIKIDGIDQETLKKALEQARLGRVHILEKMDEAIQSPRSELSEHAPKIFTMKVKQAKIKDVIGSGGKNIKAIIEETKVKIDIDDSGVVSILSSDQEAIDKAVALVKRATEEAEVGKIYDGIVKKIMDFGAFVEILPKTDGLVHISQLANRRVNQVSDVVSEGQEVKVKCIGIDDRGKIKLSIRALEEDENQ